MDLSETQSHLITLSPSGHRQPYDGRQQVPDGRSDQHEQRVVAIPRGVQRSPHADSD